MDTPTPIHPLEPHRPRRHRGPGSRLRTVARLAASCLAGAVVGLLAPGGASGQSMEVGLKAGVNRATVAWSPSPIGSAFEELRRRTAFTGGATVSVAVPLGLMIRAELLWTGKGLREVQEDGVETRLELGYLEIPLVVARRLHTGSALTPEVYAGPYLAREASCRLEADLQGEEMAFGCDQAPDGPVERRTTEWGAVGGVAVHLGNRSGPRVVLDVRYALGLRNVDGAPDVDNLDTRHRGLAITAGLTVPLRSR